jgi:prevent-host-death family protein
MQMINVYDAKTHLSRLLDQVAQGEEIIIARAGKPLAKLVPYREDDRPRVPGSWRGRVRIAPDFDVLPADLMAAFEGKAP